jgi:hypothetical protein
MRKFSWFEMQKRDLDTFAKIASELHGITEDPAAGAAANKKQRQQRARG